MIEDAAGLDDIKDKVAKRTVSNRMNSWYNRNWKSLAAYLYCK